MKEFIIHKGTHIKDRDNTSKIMKRLLIALVPIIIFGFYKNGYVPYSKGYLTVYGMLLPLIIVMISSTTSVLTEQLYIRFIQRKKGQNFKNSIINSYAIFPGLFLSLIIPINTPITIVILGSIVATVVGKMIYGGFGRNIFNPALIGGLFITFSYSSLIASKGGYLNAFELDTIGGATPLSNFSTLNHVGTYEQIVSKFGSLWDFFIGNIPGTIGEISTLLCIVAFIYLTATKVIKWKIPFTYILTVFVMTLFIGINNDMGLWFSLFQIFSGGLMFGAVFMATDPVTSPTTNVGQILYGLSLGLLTVINRFLTPYPEGVLTAILTMNLLVIILDRIGISLKFDKKKLLITFAVLLVLFTGITIYISNSLKNQNTDDNFTILDIKKTGKNAEYTVTQKGFQGLIKAKVVIKNKQFDSIKILDQKDSYFEKLEQANYIDDINNNKNTDGVDTISGATVSSKAIKTLINNVLKDVK